MSFFGFDTSLPPRAGGGGGGHPGETMDEKLRRMAAADENLEIYDFGDDDLGEGLAARLDESLDAFNDDTFAMADGEVGRDFDFSGTSTAISGNAPAPAQPAQPAQQQAQYGRQQQQQHQTSSRGGQTQPQRGVPSPFSVSFDADPLLGPVRRGAGNAAPAARPQPSQPQQQQQYAQQPQHQSYSQSQQQPQQQQQQAKPKFRTLEEIEAQIAQQQQQQRRSPAAPMSAPSPQQQQQQQPAGPRRLTVEEVEAEMLRKAQETRAGLQQQPQAHGQAGIPPPGLPQQQQQQQQQQSVGPAGDMLSQLFPGQDASPQAPSAGPPAPGISLADPNLTATIQSRMQTNEAQEAQRRRRAAKIHAMAKFNNLMTQGDRDFITRIQVSQLLNSLGPNGTHDPYADDFYFSVTQSLRQSRLAAMERQMQEMMANKASEPGQPGPEGGAPSAPGSQPQVSSQGNANASANNNSRRNGRGRNNQPEPRMTRRENAMNRMAQQVQRLVDDARKKPRATQLSLEGALGKIAIRTRSAPRPLLQMEGRSSSNIGEDSTAAGLGAAATSLSSSLNQSSASRAALNKRQVLIALERVYDIVLQLEQSRRVQPSLAAHAAGETQASEGHGNPPDFPQHARIALQENEAQYAALAREMWKGLKVMEPLDISSPHPFISLLSATKGKKLLPRALRHTDPQQTLTLLTLLVATFDTLDVVRDAHVLDMNPSDPLFNATAASYAPGRPSRLEVEASTETFLNATIPLVMGTIGRAPLRIVTGMMGLLIERNDLLKVAKTKPGLAFLTIFLTRGEVLKQTTTAAPDTPVPEQSEIDQWSGTFNHLFERLSGNLPPLFPSTRSIPFGPGLYAAHIPSASTEAILDAEDEPVWHFLAALAVSSDMHQQQALVTEVRDKVLENCMKAKNAERAAQAQGQNRAAAELIAANKIRNVNTFLHALGLDASQITVE